MDALIAHDPAKLSPARNLKMAENGVRLDLLDGFWRTATAKGGNNPDFQTGSLFSAPFSAAAATQGNQAAPLPPTAGKQINPALNPAAIGCKEAFESGYYRFINRVRGRRYVAVDVERGFVFSFVYADHPAGKFRHCKLADDRGISAWENAELFKIRGGKIHQVQALLEQAPSGMLSGRSCWEDGISSRPR